MKVPQSGYPVDNPATALITALISYGPTAATGDGAANGTTIVDNALLNEPSYDGALVKILTGPAAGQFRPIAVFGAGVLIVATAFSNAAGAAQQITAGTRYVVMSVNTGGGGPGPYPAEGLTYYGVVSVVPGANQFTIPTLAGLGVGKFMSATNPYYAFVLRKATGTSAAPQGELQPITAYDNASGTFTTSAFTVAVAAPDEILIISPTLAATMTFSSGVAVNSRTVAFSRLAGTPQIFSYHCTSAANAGDVTVATITTQPCYIKGIVVRSNGATTADLTSIGIYGGAGKVVTFIDAAATGLRANIAAADQQVAWTGAVSFAAAKTIVITLTGTGAGAVDLQVDIEYCAIADGGYLA